MPVTVPCGRCVGCRLEKSRQWATRIVHEAKLHELKCFVTLTYNNEHLPHGGTLVKKHFIDFIKRLSIRHKREYRDSGGVIESYRNVRYFHCGEYGEDEEERPHYHACLFGVDFADKRFYKKNHAGDPIYQSKYLETVWGMGFCTVGALTWETAAYTARYIMKKVTGEEAPGYYMSVDKVTGEICERIPEYVTMSLKPGIGADWAKQFLGDYYPCDFAVVKGKKLRVPRYYDSILEKADPLLLRRMKAKRSVRGKEPRALFENSPGRLRVREEVKQSQIKTLKRNKA